MIYHYECQNQDCQFLFEIEQNVKDKNRYLLCPSCEKETLERDQFEKLVGKPTSDGEIKFKSLKSLRTAKAN